MAPSPALFYTPVTNDVILVARSKDLDEGDIAVMKSYVSHTHILCAIALSALTLVHLVQHTSTLQTPAEPTTCSLRTFVATALLAHRLWHFELKHTELLLQRKVTS